jgi:dynein intermediate chain
VEALVGDAQKRKTSRPGIGGSASPSHSTIAAVPVDQDVSINAIPASQPEAVVGIPKIETVSPPVPAKRETVMYTKGTQTIDEESDDDDLSIAAAPVTTAPDEAAAAQASLEAQETLIARLREEIRAELIAKEEEERQRKLAEEPPPSSGPAAPNIEDFMRRYTLEDSDPDADLRDALQLRPIAQFASQQSLHRSITYLHFSPKFPELLLVAYSRNPLAPGEPDGLVQVFSLLAPETPVFTFTAGSEIRIAQFSPYHPQLIFGGAHSGQVLLWDTRTPGLPVLKSPQTAGRGHSHSVTAMQLVGTRNAHSLVSCAADGTVCVWSLDLLAKPQEFLQLRNLPPAKLDDLALTGMAFSGADSTRFLVSTEEGCMLRVHRQDRADVKAGVDPRIVYRGHTAPITSFDQHPASHADAASFTGKEAVSSAVAEWALTSSLDWSVKLWQTSVSKRSAAASTTASSSAYGSSTLDGTPLTVVSPLLDFGGSQPVYDARWAPHRPGMFAQVDGAGEVQIWDLCQDSEVPITRETPIVPEGTPSRALNRVAWEPEGGRRIAVGGLDGIATVFDIGEQLGAQARQQDWTKLASLIARMH